MTAHRPTPTVKTTITGTLTQAYLRKLSRETSLATISTIFVVTFSLFWMALQLGSHTPVGKTSILAFFANIMYALTSGLGAAWCFGVAYRARRGPVHLESRHQFAWLLIALALLSNATGGAIYTYLEGYVQKNPVPSWADLFFTLFYILVFAGLLLMPTSIQTAQSRIRIGLDAIITTLCILGFSWYFSIKHIFAITADPGQLYVSASYPFWDILLVLAIVYVLYQGIEPILYPSLLLLALGVAAQIGADTIYGITVPQGTYSTGTWYVDSFWFIGYLLIGLSGPYQYSSIVRNAFRDHLQSSLEMKSAEYAALNDIRPFYRRVLTLQIPLMYFPLFCILGLVLYSSITHTSDLFLITVAVLAGFFVVLRWLISNNENVLLLNERDARRAQADLLRTLTASLAEEIRLNSLLSRTVTIATTELGFDAATILLIEDYNLPTNTQSNLLARVARANTTDVTSWRFQEEGQPLCEALNGKSAEILWSDQTIALPDELSKWHREQRLLSTLFIPLVYQGKIQGCLGFSSLDLHLDQRQVYLAISYVSEVARAIEHARLYEDARERELFAQALTAVAARLNKAITAESGVGNELYHLICAEGARALQADYAILYAPIGRASNNTTGKNNRQLQAIASYSDGQLTTGHTHTWPAIAGYEQEASALFALQPTLIEINTSGQFPSVTGPLPIVSPAGTESERRTNTAPMYALSGSLRAQRFLTLHAALARCKAQTAILAPLIASDKPVALLVLARAVRPTSGQRRSFISVDLPRAQDFAEQAAIAFTNARLYQQLRDTHRQLQKLDMLKDQFMVTASHELRTPLTAVQGYLELLSQFGSELPQEQHKEFLQKARRGCDELVLLLSNVMDASRLEIEAGIRPAHLQSVSIQEVIVDVITLIEPQVKQDQRTIHTRIPDQLYVKADAARLRQVLLNLSSNALKYSPIGSPIAYYAHILPDRPEVIISIADKGSGIRPEEQTHLFQRFSRLERDLNSSVRGSGLGLYISRRLIEAMNGRIWVESSGIPGTGSTFHIQLPLA